MLAATKLKWAAVKKQSDRFDRCDRWNFVFFSAIVAIVAIIWKPGLSLYIRLYAAASKAELA